MDRRTVPLADRPAITPALTRPTSTANRLRGRLDRLRRVWRRVAVSGAAGLLAAGATTAWLTAGPLGPAEDGGLPAATGNPSTVDAVDVAPPTPAGRPALADDQRILALDRSGIALPVTPGSVVEVVGLRPTITDVRAEVLAARAEVVGVTDQAILVAVDADAAHAAAEIAAVGRVTILGREWPG